MVTITDKRDIQTIPHTKYMIGVPRKPASFMDQTMGYNIIKSEVYEFGTDDNNNVIIAIQPGDYVVQSKMNYTFPQVFRSYKDLVKHYYIPRNEKKDVIPDYRFFSNMHIRNKKYTVERYMQEASRVLKPRERRKKIKYQPYDTLNLLYDSDAHDTNHVDIFHNITQDQLTESGALFMHFTYTLKFDMELIQKQLMDITKQYNLSINPKTLEITRNVDPDENINDLLEAFIKCFNTLKSLNNI